MLLNAAHRSYRAIIHASVHLVRAHLADESSHPHGHTHGLKIFEGK